MKKILSGLLIFALTFSLMTTNIFAANPQEKTETDSQSIYVVTALDSTGKLKTYTVDTAANEEIKIPIYIQDETNSRIALKEVAALSIGRYKSGNVYYSFTESWDVIALGFTGYFSITNSSGLSEGSYYEVYSMYDEAPASPKSNVSVVGKFYTLGNPAATVSIMKTGL